MATHSSVLAWRIPGTGEPGDRKEHTSELQSHIGISYAVFCLKKIFFNDTATTEIYTLSLHDALPIYALEKEMATHSSVLAWRIPGTGEPVGCCLWGRKESDTNEWREAVTGANVLRRECVLDTARRHVWLEWSEQQKEDRGRDAERTASSKN